MRARNCAEATHEHCSSVRESAHSPLEKFEPTHVGCYEPVLVHGPNACGKNERSLTRNRSVELQFGVVRRAANADLEIGAPSPRFAVPRRVKIRFGAFYEATHSRPLPRGELMFR